MNYLKKKKKLPNNVVNFYKNKKILIIGGLGFVGTNLSNYFLTFNCKVSILSKRKISSNNFINKKIKLIVKEKISVSSLKTIINNNDYIFHLAAIKKNYLYQSKFPAEIFYLNSILNLQIIKSFSASQAKKLIILSSSTAAQTVISSDIKDKVGNYGYAISKKITEIFALLTFKQLKKNIIIVRSDNIYGEYDNFDNFPQVIPTIIKKFLLEKKVIKLQGTGRETRNFLFIDDFIINFLKISINNNPLEKIFEIKGSNKISIKKIANIIKKIMNSKKSIVFKQHSKKLIIKRNNKEKNLYTKEVDNLNRINENLKSTIDWYLRARKK